MQKTIKEFKDMHCTPEILARDVGNTCFRRAVLGLSGKQGLLNIAYRCGAGTKLVMNTSAFKAAMAIVR